MQDRPLPEVGSEIVLFVGVGDESVVGGHHGDVEVDEVAKERGFVGAGVPGGNWMVLAAWCKEEIAMAKAYVFRSSETRRSNAYRRPEDGSPSHR